MLNTVSKIRGQVKTTGYPQTEGLLGDCMLKYGRELGEGSTFGNALIEVGESMKLMAEVKDSLDINVKQTFIDPLQLLQDKDLKEIGHHLKKLEGRRLDYDYKRKRVGKIPDEEIRQAVEKFEESKDLAERSMFNFLENDVSISTKPEAFVTVCLWAGCGALVVIKVSGNLPEPSSPASEIALGIRQVPSSNLGSRDVPCIPGVLPSCAGAGPGEVGCLRMTQALASLCPRPEHCWFCRTGGPRHVAVCGFAKTAKTALGGRCWEHLSWLVGEPRSAPSAPTPSLVIVNVHSGHRRVTETFELNRSGARGPVDWEGLGTYPSDMLIVCGTVTLATSFICPRKVRLSGIKGDGRMKVPLFALATSPWAFFSV
ncbi:PREDICTED: endophilin-A3 isoform X2 [Miniopterus natalensis]|nr:PREDICTED: endophilin-A3 isoform X2 [Miniopterus natalensis]